MKQEDVPAATILTFTILSVTFLMGSALAFSLIEDDWDFATSMYFVIITMSTIGYGDVAPSTKLSKSLTMGFIFISLFILFAIFQAIMHYCINKQVSKVKERIYRRVNRAVADQSILDVEDESSGCDNKCLNAIYNSCNSTNAIFLYLFLYLAWLGVWVYYFTQLDNFQSEQFTIFDACYFGVVTSSTVGYGDLVPFEADIGNYDNTKAEMFTLGMAVVGVVLLATLAGKISTIMISVLIRMFRFECCKCCHVDATETEEQDGMQLSKETILNIKKNGAIDLRTFLAIQYSKDDDFVNKLEAGCDLFDKYDSDGNKAIEFEELKKEYRKQRQIKTQQKLMQEFLVENESGTTEMVVPVAVDAIDTSTVGAVEIDQDPGNQTDATEGTDVALDNIRHAADAAEAAEGGGDHESNPSNPSNPSNASNLSHHYHQSLQSQHSNQSHQSHQSHHSRRSIMEL